MLYCIVVNIALCLSEFVYIAGDADCSHTTMITPAGRDWHRNNGALSPMPVSEVGV